MTKVNLIHKSCKYADLIIEKISEDRIRDIVFECWKDAYAAGYAAGVKTESEYPHKEDMGR